MVALRRWRRRGRGGPPCAEPAPRRDLRVRLLVAAAGRRQPRRRCSSCPVCSGCSSASSPSRRSATRWRPACAVAGTTSGSCGRSASWPETSCGPSTTQSMDARGHRAGSSASRSASRSGASAWQVVAERIGVRAEPHTRHRSCCWPRRARSLAAAVLSVPPGAAAARQRAVGRTARRSRRGPAGHTAPMVKFRNRGGDLSGNLEDRRAMGGRGVAVGGGVVGVIVVVLIQLLGGGGGGGRASTSTTSSARSRRAVRAAPSTRPTSRWCRRCRTPSTTSRGSGPPATASAPTTRTPSSCCSRTR